MDKNYEYKSGAGFEVRAEALKARKRRETKKLIVNAGLLKAGKSTLFNALLGEKVFATDVIRATVENEKKEAEGYFLLDTPGLDANEQDTGEALKAYAEADAIVFVHNLQEGEFNRVEIDSIEKICNLYGDREIFFHKAVLVLSHKDQVEEQYPDIRRRIEEQCQDIVKGKFYEIVCVDSAGYLKGVEEGKELLKKVSGIPGLIDVLKACISNGVDLQSGRFKKEKDELISEIEGAIAELKKQMPKEAEISSAAIDQASKDIKAKADKVVKGINDTVKLPSRYLSMKSNHYKWRGKEKDYKEYRSEWDARSAGEAAIEESIRRIAPHAKQDAMNIVTSAEGYISLEKEPKRIQNRLADAYEDMRHTALNAGVTISINFNVKLRDPSKVSDGKGSSSFWYGESKLEKAIRELSYVRDSARRIDSGNFSSASGYAKRYDSNLFIDYNLRDEYVRGIFGEKLKSVEKYFFDADGAVQDVSSDAVEIVEDIHSRAYEAVEAAFDQIKEDLEKQFRELTNKILSELADKRKNAEGQEKEIQQKREDIQAQIARLEECRRSVSAI